MQRSVPLELPRHTRDDLLRAITALVEQHLDHVSRVPCGDVGEAARYEAASAVHAPIAEDGIEGGIERICEILSAGVQSSLPTSGAGYLAYVPGGGLVAAALADLFSDVVNRFTGLASAAPLFCRLEADVLRWLAAEFGYGPSARGLLTSGGSLANFSAVVTARVACLPEDQDLREARVYASRQIHHSVGRTVHLAGFPRDAMTVIPTRSDHTMDTAALEAQIRADRRDGLRPFLVMTSAGTTNTGAIDPFDTLASICEAEDCWLHVDGAYGGAFILCEEGRQRLEGIQRADSIVFDPHKGMFLPYGTGCLLVRDGAKLREAHREEAEYLEDFRLGDDALIPSPTEYGPELSRDYRGLRLWLPLMLHGASAFREALGEKLLLAQRLYEGLRALSEGGVRLEVHGPPQLSVVTFRLPPREGEPLASVNARNEAFLRDINAAERVFLSSTRLGEPGHSVLVLRACILSFRTHAREVEGLLDTVRALLP